jgi:hypothetical protein
MGVACSRHGRIIQVDVILIGEVGNAYNILFRKPEGKRLIGRPRRKWE